MSTELTLEDELLGLCIKYHVELTGLIAGRSQRVFHIAEGMDPSSTHATCLAKVAHAVLSEAVFRMGAKVLDNSTLVMARPEGAQ